MAEYIEREKAIGCVRRRRFSSKSLDGCEMSFNDGIFEAVMTIEKIPSADVRPERHGEWIFGAPNAIGFFPVRCSDCEIKIATTCSPCDWANEPDHIYCGSCGAKMDGKDGKSD